MLKGWDENEGRQSSLCLVQVTCFLTPQLRIFARGSKDALLVNGKSMYFVQGKSSQLDDIGLSFGKRKGHCVAFN